MTSVNNFFGINLSLLDASLKATYNGLLNSNNNNTLNSKENKDIYSIEIYVSKCIIDKLKTNYQKPQNDDLLKGIEKIFLYQQNKVILRIVKYDTGKDYIVPIEDDDNVKNNVITFFDKNLDHKLLNNFFKDNDNYIVFRKIFKGKIKDNYQRIGNIIIFNSLLYDFKLTKKNNKKKISFNKIIGADNVSTEDK